MQLQAYFGDDDRGVSPVIGVILMVAITVILAAVIATFVMNMGPSESTPANANWDWEYEEDGFGTNDTFVLHHEGGGEAVPSEYMVTLDEAQNERTDEVSLGEVVSTDGLSAGDSVNLTKAMAGTSGGFNLSVASAEIVWEDPEGDQSQIIDDWEP